MAFMAFKGTGKRAQNTIYYAKSLRKDVLTAVDIINDILQNSKLETAAIERGRMSFYASSRRLTSSWRRWYLITFIPRPSNMGAPPPWSLSCIPGASPRISRLDVPSSVPKPTSSPSSDLDAYIKTNYTAGRMGLVGAGGVDHAELVKLAEKHFSALSVSPPRHRRRKSYFPMMHEIRRHGPVGHLPRQRELMNLDDLVHFALREWTRLDGSTAIAEDIRRQLVTTSRRMSPKQVEQAVNAMTLDDISRVAEKFLWDKDSAMAAVGNIEGLLDYNRIRTVF
ncbi:hypothetical protein DFH07DRAFT_945263 [Mycena maculata]|uniref:mitochondrial processing peptidase n=1 Tax=Mycena maculata TaxID=230809 RepID=A0AAD7HZ31_9AGAR|nr:hypothetical protein DFH07DRAFT_945263 [Mycena maculata]